MSASTTECVVMGTSIHPSSLLEALNQVHRWAEQGQSKAVFFCNAHSVATARMDPRFCRALAQGDLKLADGAPVAFMVRSLGFRGQQRVSGPDFMLEYMARAERSGQSVFLYGGTATTLSKLQEKFGALFPSLKLHTYSPPFRDLTEAEDDAVVSLINNSGASTLWVSLGCPKQEQWIVKHRDRVRPVMLGVGAAFAFHAGESQRAPRWMQNSGLEWLHRLLSDPKRLWKRYLVTNTVFLTLAAAQLAAWRMRRFAR